jgi:5S rRNA maturation endonuclease (ribonuclease M5)
MYNTLTVTDNVTLDKILQLVDEYHIYSHYLGQTVTINKPISSPFRKDQNPSWSLFRSKQNQIMYKDFATGETGNVVKFVQILFDIKYHESLNKIWKDLIATNKIKQRRPKVEPELKIPAKVIGVRRKYFTKTDEDYWSKYGIDKDTLKYFNVSPIDSFWVNDIQQPYKYTKECPMYAYKVFNKFKIYRPCATNREDKWRNNCGPYDIQGWEQLPCNDETIIITKSLKDVMVLYKLGYNAIAPQSENSAIPKKIVDNIKERFKRIVILFDNDTPGKEAAKKLSEKYDIPFIYLPLDMYILYKVKDISDVVKELGIEVADNHIKRMLDEVKESYK